MLSSDHFDLADLACINGHQVTDGNSTSAVLACEDASSVDLNFLKMHPCWGFTAHDSFI